MGGAETTNILAVHFFLHHLNPAYGWVTVYWEDRKHFHYCQYVAAKCIESFVLYLLHVDNGCISYNACVGTGAVQKRCANDKLTLWS